MTLEVVRNSHFSFNMVAKFLGPIGATRTPKKYYHFQKHHEAKL